MRLQSPKKLLRNRETGLETDGVMLDESTITGPVDFKSIFGNDRPVEIEIGSGKGTFLVARAAARPEVNFLGIEYARAYCRHAADRMKRNDLQNVRMLGTDAEAFVRKFVPDSSIMRLHIYFPDPWPKRRHHRRRIMQRPFLDEVRRILIPGGQLIVVTDHRGYFLQIRRVLTDAPGFANIPMPKMSAEDGEIVGTNFERKYIAQGRKFHSIARMKYL